MKNRKMIIGLFGLCALLSAQEAGAYNVRPYIDMGEPEANVSTEWHQNTSARINESMHTSGYQALAGINYESDAVPGAIMHILYKYFTAVGQSESQAAMSPERNNYSSQNIEVGMQVKF